MLTSRKNPWYNKVLDKLLTDKKFHRFLLYYLAIPLAILILLYIVMNSVVMPIVTRHGSEFALPNIVGYEYKDAEYILDKLGLKMEVTSEEYHPDKPEGTILSQYPEALIQVKSGRSIKVVKSSGQKLVEIPVLAGFSVRQAKLNIEAAGLELGDIAWTFSDSLPERVVVFSYPPSGSDIPHGSKVNLMVNRGRLSGIVFMPQLVGKSFDETAQIIDDLGLKIGLVTHVRNENYLPGTVLEQSVEQATELEVGEEIDLIVSTTE
jgi:serine/threonine-protein kinase